MSSTESEAESFDLEQLSQAIGARAEAIPAESADEFEREGSSTTLPVHVDDIPLASVDETVDLSDPISRGRHLCFVDEEGRFLLYRVAVLGIGAAVEDVHKELRSKLGKLRDALPGDLDLEVRYNVGLFGGQVQGENVAAADAEHLGDRLAIYRPNLLVLVNAGQVRQRFADRSPQQLAVLTRYINHGALFGGQRPYALVLVTDQLIAEPAFSTYARACQALHTYPALLQLEPKELARITRFARFEAARFARDHLQLAQKLPREAALDLDLDLEDDVN